MLIRRTLAGISAAALAGLTSLTVVPAAVAAPSTGALTRLPSDVIPGLGALAPAGAAPATQKLTVDIDLANARSAAEVALNRAIYTKGNPQYHQYVTPAQYDAMFAVPASETDAALQWATRDGLSVTRVNGTGDMLTLSGTVAQAAKTFAVTISDYTWHGFSFYANRDAPSVPTALQITGIDGLNDAQHMHTTDKAPSNAVRHGTVPAQDTCDPTGSACVGVTTPNDIRSVYDAPAGNQGQGQEAAVFGEGDYNGPITDLRLFEKNFGLPKVPVKVILTESSNPSAYSDTSGDGEWDLDTQAITGVAPQIQQLDMYFATSLNDPDVAAEFSVWADDASGPKQANASFGECEYDPISSKLPTGTDNFAAGQAFTVETEKILTQATSEGRTLFASAGDDGSSCPILPADTNGVANQAFPDVNYPCASPEAVCVGGTVLYTTGGDTEAAPNPSLHAKRVLEYTWTFTGGGTSVVFPQPAWQSGVTPVPGQCLYDDTGAPVSGATPCRAVPDVAAQSGDVVTNGYSIYTGGTLSESGGTSLSSPLNVGMWTLDQAASPKAAGNGFAAPVFYKHASDFFDIGGSASSPPTSNGYFTSAPGWDYTSGLGVQDVANLEKAVDGTTTPVNDVASPGTGTETVVDNQGHAVSTGTGTTGGAPVDPACVPLFSGPPNSAAYPQLSPVQVQSYPQLSVIQGDMHTVSIKGVENLQTVLTVQDMQDGPTAVAQPGGANEYYMTWGYKGTTYFTNAEVAVTGDSFNYGSITKVGTTNQYSNAGTATGTIVTGKDGTITIDVPLSDIGSPALTDTLTGPAAAVYVEVGAPAVGGSLQPADTAGPGYDFTLDEVCAATGQPGSDGGAGVASGEVPEAPLAIGIPAAGLLLAGGLVIRRRRRAEAAVMADHNTNHGAAR